MKRKTEADFKMVFILGEKRREMRVAEGSKEVSADRVIFYFLRKKNLKQIWQNVKICLNWVMAD